MAWTPSYLTREQMEERRLEGGRLLQDGTWSQSEIADHLGVSRATVSDWSKTLKAGGLRKLHRRPTPGRPIKLTQKQQRELPRYLKRGARAAGFDTDAWTSPRVKLLIERLYGQAYHPNYITRLLRRLDWKPRPAMPRA